VLESGQEVGTALSQALHLTPTPFRPLDTQQGTAPDVIVLSSKNNDPNFDALAAGNTAGDAPRGAGKTMDAALALVHDGGSRLVLWGNGDRPSHWMIQELANRKIVTMTSWVDRTGAPWFGSWYFVRKHWLFDGLPTGAMDWRYDNAWEPVNAPGETSTGGASLSAPGLEIACGYSNNEKKAIIGGSACVIPYGKGEIVWYCLPQLVTALTKEGLATHSAVARRLLANVVLQPKTTH